MLRPKITTLWQTHKKSKATLVCPTASRHCDRADAALLEPAALAESPRMRRSVWPMLHVAPDALQKQEMRGDRPAHRPGMPNSVGVGGFASSSAPVLAGDRAARPACRLATVFAARVVAGA
jgi:hypothetical protein